jgi:sec-independent protein translocase protein TatC
VSAFGITRLRSVGHDDRLSVVDHLDELRTRMIVALAVVGVAFAFCFWQNSRLLQIVNKPLAHQTQKQVRAGHGPLGATYTVQQSARDVAVQLRSVVGVLESERATAAAGQSLEQVGLSLDRDIKRLSAAPTGDKPVTLGIGEPFMTTVTVSLIFALILSLPLLLLQVYGFFMPALEPEQRKRLRPLLIAVPLLFITGVAFGYFVVLPAAIRFFQNFNSTEFNVLVQASQYYKFAATTLLAMGLLFQVPVAILAVTRAGVLTPRQLRRHRRYAIAICAAVAAFLPGDAITMLLETVPLYLLFEASVIVATVIEARDRRARAAAAQAAP